MLSLNNYTTYQVPFLFFKPESFFLNSPSFVSDTVFASPRNKFCADHGKLKLFLVTESPRSFHRAVSDSCLINIPLYVETEVYTTIWEAHLGNADRGVRNVLKVVIEDIAELDYDSRENVKATLWALKEAEAISFECYCEKKNQNLVSSLFETMKNTTTVDVKCPEGQCNGRIENGLWDMIIHLNDFHKWTRETIADWVEDVAEEQGLDISFPVPADVPKEPGEK